MLADLLSKRFAADLEETWKRERTANALTGVAVRPFNRILSKMNLRRPALKEPRVRNERRTDRGTPEYSRLMKNCSRRSHGIC
jgi:hypothetical protein